MLERFYLTILVLHKKNITRAIELLIMLTFYLRKITDLLLLCFYKGSEMGGLKN